MDHSFIWLVTGIVLVIAELVTGTFYLLFLGIAAIVGAAVAHLGAPFWAQAIISAVVLTMGVIWIQRHKRMAKEPAMRGLDIGQPVKWESWINETDGLARVRYRDAHWDAKISGDIRAEPGEVLYITAVDGATLHVAKSRPA
jgi:membrane protein implicated in regulation of membrane protease activity